MNDYFDRVESQLGDLIADGAHRRRRRPLPRLRLGALVPVVAVGIALAVVAVLLLTVHRNPGPSVTTGAGSGRISPSLVRSFKILRAPATGPDSLPREFTQGGLTGLRRGMFPRSSTTLTGEPALPTVAAIGLLPSLTRQTVIPGTGYRAWVIPGRNGMCWLAADGAFPDPAVCVGTVRDPGTDIIDGPWPDVDASGIQMVGLVTDNVLAVKLVEGPRHSQTVPLSDGFYVSPLVTGSQRLVAVTRHGVKRLYPQTVPKGPLIADSATTTVARSSTPQVVLSGQRGAVVRLSLEMTCTATGGGGRAVGYQRGGTYRLPATVPVGFPAGSQRLHDCYVAATVSEQTHAKVRVEIVVH